MNKYIENFYNLYSESDSVVYKAILEKKDWLFQKLYIPFTFEKKMVNGKETYPYLYALMDQSVIFQDLTINDTLFEEHEDKKDAIKKAFDKDFTCLYLYSKLTTFIKEGTFFVEFDFSKMDNKQYKELVANFYPCISEKDDLDLFYDENRIEDLLKYAMYGEENKWVLIIAKSLLLDGKYYMPFAKKIYFNKKKINDEQLEGLKEVAERCSLEIEEYYGE